MKINDLASWPIVAHRRAEFCDVSEGFGQRAMKDMLAMVQRYAKTEVVEDSVHIRGMRIVNSERDFYYSRFAQSALDEIAELLPGRPVMAGHDYRGLPLGTFFAAGRTVIPVPKKPKRDSHWVEALFYVPKDEMGDQVVRRIDLGNWRENSLGWVSVADECSTCRGNIRTCEHVPGEVYQKGFCEYEMSGVTTVLEGSLVFAGGQKGTDTFVPGERLMSVGRLVTGEYVTTRQLREVKVEAAKGAGPDEIEIIVRDAVHVNSAGMRGQVSAILCSRSRFDTAKDAASWVRDHSFRADRAGEVGAGFTFTQFETDPEKKPSRVKLDDGIFALVGHKKAAAAPVDRGLDALFAE